VCTGGERGGATNDGVAWLWPTRNVLRDVPLAHTIAFVVGICRARSERETSSRSSSLSGKHEGFDEVALRICFPRVVLCHPSI
jgi:hypothetical protein